MNSREREFLDNAWEDLAGVKREPPVKVPPLDELRKTQWCPLFEKLMRNRLIMGAFRYGLMSEQDFSTYDLVEECKKRLDLFVKDGNLEHLVDAANMLLLRFFWGNKNKEKFEAIDDGVHSTKLIKS